MKLPTAKNFEIMISQMMQIQYFLDTNFVWFIKKNYKGGSKTETSKTNTTHFINIFTCKVHTSQNTFLNHLWYILHPNAVKCLIVCNSELQGLLSHSSVLQ